LAAKPTLDTKSIATVKTKAIMELSLILILVPPFAHSSRITTRLRSKSNAYC
jgi:hypothetical protein